MQNAGTVTQDLSAANKTLTIHRRRQSLAICGGNPVDFQSQELFVPRKKLSDKAQRAGWQGFYYDLSFVPEGAFVRLFKS